jgi:dTDP-4-dehydrorhamnose reductase
LALAPRDIALAGTGGRRPVRPGNWRELHLDLGTPSAVREVMEREQPSAVFFCAYDKSNPVVTVDAAVAAARAAAARGTRFVFFSTDLVFDGRAGSYGEDAPSNPVSPYGAMKREAEALVMAEHPGALIIRTSILVGESGVMLRPAFECDAMVRGRAVDLYRDEWRSPLHVDDLARAAWELCILDVAGVYHVAGSRLSRLELGRILCTLFRFSPALVREADRPASRPRDTSLDSRRAAELLGWSPRPLAGLLRQPAGV